MKEKRFYLPALYANRFFFIRTLLCSSFFQAKAPLIDSFFAHLLLCTNYVMESFFVS